MIGKIDHPFWHIFFTEWIGTDLSTHSYIESYHCRRCDKTFNVLYIEGIWRKTYERKKEEPIHGRDGSQDRADNGRRYTGDRADLLARHEDDKRRRRKSDEDH